jgi:uncharacterized protein (UPF0548 family)/ligand-binding SRPBCC domain-containing protein
VPRSVTILTRTTASPDALFDLSLDIDAHLASMAGSGERAVGGVTSGSIGLGETVTWRARHFGVWFTMTSKITAFDRPHRFVDEQVRGPFRVFRHEHRFERAGEVTVMIDRLTVGSPVLGRLAESVVLVPYLRRLIRSRNHHLLSALGVAPTTDPASERWMPGETFPYRRAASTTLIGYGDAVWERASADVLRWAVKTRSGFRVPQPREVRAGQRLAITAGLGPVRVCEPVEVVAVVDDPDRVGFSYRTLPGHPVRGEEAFVVHRNRDAVFLTLRSLTAPAPRGRWRVAYPLLRVAQLVARARYRRALR